ncbi:ChrR family anti-sigma-E factor [Paenacidovorax monticola]|uniref:Cupin domain-containing protein n=1 Tax=Paenacidovorax monticola TaxID=1926868 RepID=A0A7H0HCZ8_9BURK|nr:ChrR family anti-sigma-E factor [Paenacidovorax monticola]QNP58414.1 cupin domain-containing protein [Paenacidovorax monticola]
MNAPVQHPGDDLLLAHAAGQLAAGPAILVATHLEGCAHCRERMRTLQATGGALLESLPEASLPPDALARTMASIDALHRPGREWPAPVQPTAHPALPDGMSWPKALRGCQASRWHWMGPGMRWSRVTVPYDPAANVFLLRIAAGKFLPQHTHSERELTQVLYGRFHDGRAMFGPGDFDDTDPTIRHQPVVQAEGECICIASVEGRVVFDGFIARTLGTLVGM